MTTYTPDLLSRLETVGTVAGASTVTQTAYTYDAVGNRTSRSDPTRLDFTYDNVYRLTTTTARPCRICAPVTYEYDEVGNRLNVSGLGPVGPDWTYSDRNELLASASASYTYDSNGNLATKVEGADTWSYEWSVENQLTRVVKNGSEVASFQYDPLGRRVQKIAGGVTRQFAYDREDITRERLVGVKTLRYVHGPGIDEPLASEQLNPSAMTYYHADGLGSIVKTTNSAGTVTLTRTYDSFGIPSDGTTTPGYAYTAREWDPETGLYYYRARYYDPKIGRFLSEDPIGIEGGINMYLYVDDNPVNAIDPTGLKKCGCTKWETAWKAYGYKSFRDCVTNFLGVGTVVGMIPAAFTACGKGPYGGAYALTVGGLAADYCGSKVCLEFTPCAYRQPCEACHYGQ